MITTMRTFLQRQINSLQMPTSSNWRKTFSVSLMFYFILCIILNSQLFKNATVLYLYDKRIAVDMVFRSAVLYTCTFVGLCVS